MQSRTQSSFQQLHADKSKAKASALNFILGFIEIYAQSISDFAVTILR